MSETEPAYFNPSPVNSGSPLPSAWPGAFGLFKYSKEAVMLNVATLVLLFVVPTVIQLPLDFIIKGKWSLLTSIVSIVIGGFFGVATARVQLAGARGNKLDISDAFSNVDLVWLRLIGLQIVSGFIALLSVLLLIIPAFIVIPRLQLSTYFLVDQKLGIIAAMKASWHATKGHLGKLYGIFGVSILMSLLIFTIIGIPAAIILLVLYSAAVPLLYLYVTVKQHEPDSQNPTIIQPNA